MTLLVIIFAKEICISDTQNDKKITFLMKIDWFLGHISRQSMYMFGTCSTQGRTLAFILLDLGENESQKKHKMIKTSQFHLLL